MPAAAVKSLSKSPVPVSEARPRFVFTENNCFIRNSSILTQFHDFLINIKMGTPDSFNLQWNEFGSCLTEAIKTIRSDKEFFDVTLAFEDSQVEAHKLILGACSPFFRDIFKKNPHTHPLLYLKGVKYKEMVGILNFMYMGQVKYFWKKYRIHAFISSIFLGQHSRGGA